MEAGVIRATRSLSSDDQNAWRWLSNPCTTLSLVQALAAQLIPQPLTGCRVETQNASRAIFWRAASQEDYLVGGLCLTPQGSDTALSVWLAVEESGYPPALNPRLEEVLASSLDRLLSGCVTTSPPAPTRAARAGL